jgi:hypothetical protein
MHVAELVNQTRLLDRQIEKSFSHLLFTKNAVFANERISLKKTSRSGGGSATIYNEIKVIDLLEMTANAEGSFVNKTASAYGMIEVGVGGAIQLADGEFFVMNLSDLTNDKTYQVYAVEAPVLTNVALTVESININAGVTSKKQDSGTAAVLLVPTSVKSIDVQFVNGNTARYLKEELLAMVGMANDIVSIEETAIVYGAKNLLSFNLIGTRSFEIYTDGTSFNYLLVIPKEV